MKCSYKQVQGFDRIEVVRKFTVAANSRESKPVHVAPLPELAQPAQADIGVAADQADKCA
jgi:hypothetical protein